MPKANNTNVSINSTVSMSVSDLATMIAALNTTMSVLSTLTQSLMPVSSQNANVGNPRASVGQSAKQSGAPKSVNSAKSVKSVRTDETLPRPSSSSGSGSSPYRNDLEKGVFYAKVTESEGRLRLSEDMFKFAESNSIKITCPTNKTIKSYHLGNGTDARPKVQGRDFAAEIGEYVKFVWNNAKERFNSAVMTDIAGFAKEETIAPKAVKNVKQRSKGTVKTESFDDAPIIKGEKPFARKMRLAKLAKQQERNAVSVPVNSAKSNKRSANVVSQTVHTSPKSVTVKPVRAKGEMDFSEFISEARNNARLHQRGKFELIPYYTAGDIRRVLSKETKSVFNKMVSRAGQWSEVNSIAKAVHKQAFTK